eukprot:INCI20159.1.p1 GENE.INCI20159.1~~INCI20159.1.p1  ORF type:complete len:280 (-),score=68.66 INCI20159.1:90-929(-)
MAESSDHELVVLSAIEHKALANSLFERKAFLESSEEYQAALDDLDAQLFALRDMKHVLCRNKARAVFLHARSLDDDAQKVEFLTMSLEDARAAVDLNVNDPKAQYTLGRIALQLNKPRTAVTALRKAVELDSDILKKKKVSRFLEANKSLLSLPDRTPTSGDLLGLSVRRSSSSSGGGSGGGSGSSRSGIAAHSAGGSVQALMEWAKGQGQRSRPFVLVAVVWYMAGAAVKARGNVVLGERIQQLLKLALIAGGALFLQGQVQQHTRAVTKFVIGKVFG